MGWGLIFLDCCEEVGLPEKHVPQSKLYTSALHRCSITEHGTRSSNLIITSKCHHRPILEGGEINAVFPR